MAEERLDRWVWYGGRVSLDFVNTRQDRDGLGSEFLGAPDDLGGWLEAAGLTAGRSCPDLTTYREAVELREAVDAAVRSSIGETPIPAGALRCLNRWLDDPEHRPPQLTRSPDGLVLRSAGLADRDALRAIALDAAQLVGTDLRVRLRVCPGNACGGRFLDDSPAGRRRWCSMATCGNRHKAAVHRSHRRLAD